MRKAVKCRLLEPTGQPTTLTVAICADHREAGCASGRELKASWKHLRRRARDLSRQPGVSILALPTRCLDVCKLGPLLAVTDPASGRPPEWYGCASPPVIDAILEAALAGERPPQQYRLAVDPPAASDDASPT